jgi:hypothetical protein
MEINLIDNLKHKDCLNVSLSKINNWKCKLGLHWWHWWNLDIIGYKQKCYYCLKIRGD